MRKRKKNSMRTSVGFLIFALFILIGVVSVQIAGLYQKNVKLDNEAKVLEQRIQEATQDQQELLNYQEYMQTTDYIEDLAREKFGLIKPDETLFITKPD